MLPIFLHAFHCPPIHISHNIANQNPVHLAPRQKNGNQFGQYLTLEFKHRKIPEVWVPIGSAGLKLMMAMNFQMC